MLIPPVSTLHLPPCSLGTQGASWKSAIYSQFFPRRTKASTLGRCVYFTEPKAKQSGYGSPTRTKCRRFTSDVRFSQDITLRIVVISQRCFGTIYQSHINPQATKVIYIYIHGAPILDVSRSHTTTQHSR